jgi:hypothetical protein
MNCRRGDIVLVLFPDSNLRMSKRRPASVVKRTNWTWLASRSSPDQDSGSTPVNAPCRIRIRASPTDAVGSARVGC